MPRVPTVSYGDSYTPGQLAQQWQKPTTFVRRMIEEGKLVVSERGIVTNEALGNFYKQHGTELD
jgi:hypothetical protein